MTARSASRVSLRCRLARSTSRRGDLASTTSAATAWSVSWVPTVSRYCSPVARPVTIPWSTALREDRDRAKVLGTNADATTRPTPTPVSGDVVRVRVGLIMTAS
jgi:hypothetical protein